jgi:2-oxoisovalerate dehydrogenase E1 component
MAGAVNQALGAILQENPRALMLGEDIEDPKGGVFGLTKGLSSRHPGRVVNSPLAEATIAGLASGLPAAGFLPIFELQFVDFIGPAFNQIVNQIATLRWRSLGAYKCPLVIYAPCGSFIGGGGPWHSQTNESWLLHAPGLKVYMPGNANDAAQLLYSAANGDDPVMLLLPKNQFQKSVARETELRLYPERARIRRTGGHVTLVAWGNCVELVAEAAEALAAQGVGADVLDLCSLAPCDWQALHASVRKTGRLVVVQEDARSCSFGQAIISNICGSKPTWERLYAAPQLVSRDDVHIGFSRVLESAALPDVGKILHAVKVTLGQADE